MSAYKGDNALYNLPFGIPKWLLRGIRFDEAKCGAVQEVHIVATNTDFMQVTVIYKAAGRVAEEPQP